MDERRDLVDREEPERQGAPEHGGQALTGDKRWTVDGGTGRSDATLTWGNGSGHISIDWSSEDPRWWSEIYNDDRAALAALVADVQVAARLRSLAAPSEESFDEEFYPWHRLVNGPGVLAWTEGWVYFPVECDGAVDKLLAALADRPDPAARTARFRCRLVLMDADGRELVVDGTVECDGAEWMD